MPTQTAKLANSESHNEASMSGNRTEISLHSNGAALGVLDNGRTLYSKKKEDKEICDDHSIIKPPST